MLSGCACVVVPAMLSDSDRADLGGLVAAVLLVASPALCCHLCIALWCTDVSTSAGLMWPKT
mgnify:CR=1 FL=1